MSTLLLITEGKKDVQIVLTLVQRKYPHIKIVPFLPTQSNPNVSHLAKQLEKLLAQAIRLRQKGDCIAVVHDADLKSRPHGRQDYERIRAICESEPYRREVSLVVAYDEIEAWLLADSGLCAWLGTNPRNYDEQLKPSETLITLLDRANKPKYTLANIKQILQHVDGTGEQHSLSLRQALDNLKDAPCARIGSST